MSADGRRSREAAASVLRWVAFYTRGLSPTDAAERQDELLSDLHEQTAWAESAGVSDARLARSIRRRALLGVPADVAWRQRLAWEGRAPGRIRLRAHEALLLATAAVGVLLAVGGGFVVARVVRALLIGDIGYVPRDSVVIGALAVASLFALVLLARPATRVAGAALLVPASVLLPLLAAPVLYVVSASAVPVLNAATWWPAAALLIGGGLALLCGACAATSLERRRAFRATGRAHPHAPVRPEGSAHARTR
ncbi:hypothetical protein [Agromyces mangrovi Wang et al. 2018]|uniref:hypothetical protein n=1 Tax=Agromyces mangrovi TaxID=1858653 RepID=UPI002572D9AE|nr:hypothetical protein [Agromyces mangrovi]BDZ65066.1 hypothetical protein GCM10025877_20040 [Agromyces mangrovi]